MRRHPYSQLLATLIGLATAFQSGCMSSRTSEGIGYATVHQFFFGAMDIPFWVDSFWERKGRLPTDYSELTTFVSKRTNGHVNLAEHPRVDFTLLPSGQRHADFYVVEDGKTNIASRLTWGKPRLLDQDTRALVPHP